MSYNVSKESTFHLVLRLRGQGDMLSNHVLSSIPAKNAKDIPISTTVTVLVDKGDHCESLKFHRNKIPEMTSHAKLLDQHAVSG